MKSGSKKSKLLIWSSIAIIAVVAGYFLFFNKSGKTITVNSDKVERETLMKMVSATGTIKPILSVEVGTQVSGTIEKLYVDFNDNVKAGQVIARMDTRNLIASVKGSEATLMRTEVQLKQARRALDRNKELFAKGNIAKIDLENAEDDFLLATASYNSAKLELERNHVNLDYATIKSPIDGVVISRKVDIGQTVAATFATPTFYVIANDLRKMKIEASVDEADIGMVKAGQQVEFAVDAFPDDTFTGIVNRVELESVTLQNVVTYIVEININNMNMKLIPGMTANLEIVVTKTDTVLTIPNGVFDFVMTEELADEIESQDGVIERIEPNSKNTIWVKRHAAYKEITVETGFSNGIKTEIKAAVEQGDEIVNSIEIAKGGKKSGSFIMPQRQKDNSKK